MPPMMMRSNNMAARLAVALLPGLLLPACTAKETTTPAASAPSIMTVNGPVPAQAMGITLPHEHVLVDFAGADAVSPQRYDRAEVFAVALPYLRQARALGVQTLVEATPAYLGRDPLLLQQLAEASGLHLLVSTGYYGAREDRHLPPHAFSESADALAARWVAEWRSGIDGTGIRPGLIKIGVDPGALSAVDRTLIRAAARAHLETGLTIAAHTGAAAGAFAQLAVLEEEGVDASAWIWVHAQGEADATLHARAARSGAWVSFDGLAPDNVGAYVQRLLDMKAAGVLHRVLVSHDAGWYHVGEAGGGAFRGYDTLLRALVPALRSAGFSGEEIDGLIVRNPGEAFAVRVRARPGG